jgi:hypothetical protein
MNMQISGFSGDFINEVLRDKLSSSLNFIKDYSRAVAYKDKRINGETTEVHLASVEYEALGILDNIGYDLSNLLSASCWMHDFVEDFRGNIPVYHALNNLYSFLEETKTSYSNIELPNLKSLISIIDSLTKNKNTVSNNKHIQKYGINKIRVGTQEVPADYMLKPNRAMGNIPLRNKHKKKLNPHEIILASTIALCDNRNNFDPQEFIHEGLLEEMLEKTLLVEDNVDSSFNHISSYIPSEDRENYKNLLRNLKKKDMERFKESVREKSNEKNEKNKKQGAFRGLVLSPYYMNKILELKNEEYQGERIVTDIVETKLRDFCRHYHEISLDYLLKNDRNINFNLIREYARKNDFDLLETVLLEKTKINKTHLKI